MGGREVGVGRGVEYWSEVKEGEMSENWEGGGVRV